MHEQLALKKLKELKLVLAGGQVPGFVFSKHFGICANLHINSENREFGIQYLSTAFDHLGLDCTYPVEGQVCDTYSYKHYAFSKNDDKYNPSTELGRLRLELLDKLIQYFEERV